MTFLVKICGNKPYDIPRILDIIANFTEEQLRIYRECKIDPRIGILVGQKHSSPDFIALSRASEIIKDSQRDRIVVVTHLDDLSALVDLTGETDALTVQLHNNHPTPEIVEELKKEYPDRQFWHAIHAPQRCDDPTRQLALEQDTLKIANELVAAGVEEIILDTYDKKNNKVGGTGVRVEGDYAKRFRDLFKGGDHSAGLILAGGLRPTTIVDAIRTIRPDGIDANTGLNISEFDRNKDLEKVKAFLGGAIEDSDDILRSAKSCVSSFEI